jgi:hypothetical protein
MPRLFSLADQPAYERKFSTIDTGNPVRFDQVSQASAAINRPLSNTDTDRAAGGE